MIRLSSLLLNLLTHYVGGRMPTNRTELRVPRITLETVTEVVVVAIVTFLVLYPVGMLVYGSFRSAAPGAPGYFHLENYLSVFNSPWYLTVFSRTIAVGVVSTTIAVLLGLTSAWIIARTDTPFSGVLHYVAAAPIYTSAFLGAVAWILLASPEIGYLNSLAKYLFPFVEGPVFNIYSYWGMVWVMGGFYSPYVFLLVSGALKSMDPSLEEVSRLSGANILQTTLRITLPLVAPAILSAVLLVFVLSIAQFGIPMVLGWPVNYAVLTTKIFALLQFPPINYGLGTALSVILLAITFSIVYLNSRVIGRRQFITVTGKGFRPGIVSLGKWRYFTCALCVMYLGIVAVMPLLVVLVSSFCLYTGRILPLTLENYVQLVRGLEFPRAFRNSMLIALVGATMCILLATIISWVVNRTRLPGRKIIDYICTMQIAIPAVVLGVGMLWAWVIFPVGIYGTIWIMVIACISHFISYGVRSTSSSLVQIHQELEESSRICGASWLRTLKDITLPLLKPGMLSGWTLLFIVFFRELTIVLFLWTPSTITLPVLLYDQWSNGGYPALSAIGMVQAAVIFVVTFLSEKVLKAPLGRMI